MTKNDIPEVLLINREDQASPWHYGVYTDCMKVKYDCFVIQNRSCDEISGYIILKILQGESYILDFGIANEDRRKGIGKTLLQFAIDLSKSKGARGIVLDVKVDNEKAIKLYESMGFKKEHLKKNYYKDSDAYLMVLKFLK